MKGLLVTLLLLGLVAPATAVQCWPEELFFEVDDWTCWIVPAVGEERVIDVNLYTGCRPAPLTSVSFSIDNWPDLGDPPGAVVEELWEADAVAGGLASGITLSWAEGLEPSSVWGLSWVYHLGQIRVLPLAEDWLAGEHVVTLDDLTLTDEEGHAYTGPGPNWFRFNPGSIDWCGPIYEPTYSPWCEWRHVTPEAGSTVDSGFVFRGQAEHWQCSYGVGLEIDITVRLNGEVVGDYSGDGELDVELPIDLSGIAGGERFLLSVDFETDHYCHESYEYSYTRDITATKPQSFSAVKSRY